jgi:hypothetical protein
MKKRGRPTLPDSEKQKYLRVAVYPRTHERIKNNAKREKLAIVDYLDKKIKEPRV